MAIDAELLEILACPDCKAKIEYIETESVIVCTGCGLRYPVRDDIPVMLVEEAEKPSESKADSGGGSVGD